MIINDFYWFECHNYLFNTRFSQLIIVGKVSKEFLWLAQLTPKNNKLVAWLMFFILFLNIYNHLKLSEMNL